MYSWNKTLHVSASSSVHHHEFFTVHTTMIYDIRCTGLLIACEQDQDGTHFSNIFLEKKTLHVSDSSSVHQQEFFTVHTAMVYVIQVCWQLASRTRMELQFRPDPARKLSAKLYLVRHISLVCVRWETRDDGQRNCPKHVELYSKNKSEKVVHLVGFIIRSICILIQSHGNPMSGS